MPATWTRVCLLSSPSPPTLIGDPLNPSLDSTSNNFYVVRSRESCSKVRVSGKHISVFPVSIMSGIRLLRIASHCRAKLLQATVYSSIGFHALSSSPINSPTTRVSYLRGVCLKWCCAQLASLDGAAYLRRRPISRGG